MSQYAIRPLLTKCTERITYWSVLPLRCALFRCSDGNERTLQTLAVTFTWAAVGCCCCRHVNTSADSAVFGNSDCISETVNAFRKHSTTTTTMRVRP